MAANGIRWRGQLPAAIENELSLLFVHDFSVEVFVKCDGIKNPVLVCDIHEVLFEWIIHRKYPSSAKVGEHSGFVNKAVKVFNYTAWCSFRMNTAGSFLEHCPMVLP